MQLNDKQSLILKSKTNLLGIDDALSLFVGIANGKLKINERILIVYKNGNESFYYLYSPIFNKIIRSDILSLKNHTFNFEYTLDEYVFQILTLYNLEYLEK